MEFQFGEKIIGNGMTTIVTSKGVIKVVQTAAEYRVLAEGLEKLGYIGVLLEVAINTSEYANKEISGARFTYRMVGTGISFATPFLYCLAVGSEGGPAGALLGAAVGGVWVVGEKVHDNITRDYPPPTPAGYENINLANLGQP